uniref:IMCp domain-containing protein n=1 Tax=Candidatus Electronema sp. TaxID=2698783 RepID=UPI0040569591
MKKKILFSAALFAALAAPAVSVQAASILRTVGRHPVSAPLATVEDLRAMMHDMDRDIQSGMTTAGYPDLFPLVQAHIANYPQTQIAIVDYQPGQQIDWMLFRRNGKGRVKVARDVTWGGNVPLQAFEFAVDKDGHRYTFAVPLQCGNLALKESFPAPVQVVQQQAPVVQYKEVIKEVPGPTVYVPKEVVKYVDRPVVKEVVRTVPGPTVYVPKEVVKYVDRPMVKEVVRTVPGPTVYVPKEVVKYVDKPVEVVKYVDKEVVREVQVPGPTRTVVKKVMVPGPTKTVYVDKPVIKEVVKTEAKCCESPFHFIADLGWLHQKEEDHVNYGLGRLGVEYVASPQFSFLALAGGAVKAGGDSGEDAFVLDFLVQYNFFQCTSNGATAAPFFAGLGIGAWMTSGDDDVASENSGADIIAELGMRIFGNPTGTSAAIFLEGRAATDELDELEEYGRIGAGLRFRF